MTASIAKYKNGINARNTADFKGKQVTACGHVYGIKNNDKVCFLNVGEKFPNSPLTVVIFAKDKKNFLQPLDEMYAGKNICVKGEVVEFNGKFEIIVTKPGDIIAE